jgi:hypothetical protein
MKLELLIFAVTGFLIVNTYYDGKFVHIMKGWKKYYQMAFVAFAGICAYILIRKNPNNTRDLFSHANNFVKYMPIDKNTENMLTPILDFTSKSFYNESGMNGGINGGMDGGMNGGMNGGMDGGHGYTPQQKRMLNSGTKATKRSVSETKKKFVAANQAWTCDHCKVQLPAWYEIDHKVRLEYGGSNHVDNLVALCRNCHGKKTALENL